MTYEEAIIHFKDQLDIFVCGEHHEAMKVAIEALEKQIPKNYGWTETCLAIQKILIEHGVEPLGELANAIFDAVPHCEENNNDWIPCSERMPRYNQHVLVCRAGMAMPILVDKYSGYYGEDDCEWYEGWVHSNNCIVVAWKPLPEPYKEGE